MLTDFGIDKVKQALSTEFVQQNILKNHCLDQVDKIYPDIEDEEREISASRLRDKLSKVEIETIFERSADDMHRQFMEEAIEANYDKIKQDIVDMLDELCLE